MAKPRSEFLFQKAAYPVDAGCFNAGMGACEKSSHWQAALCLFQDMSKLQLCDAVSVTTLISSISKSQLWQLALATFMQTLKRNEHRHGWRSGRIGPDQLSSECSCALMSAFARAEGASKGHAWRMALKLLEEGL